MRPGIRVVPVPSIRLPPSASRAVGRTAAMVPSPTVTSKGPSIRPATLSKTFTFVMLRRSLALILVSPVFSPDVLVTGIGRRRSEEVPSSPQRLIVEPSLSLTFVLHGHADVEHAPTLPANGGVRIPRPLETGYEAHRRDCPAIVRCRRCPLGSAQRPRLARGRPPEATTTTGAVCPSARLLEAAGEVDADES